MKKSCFMILILLITFFNTAMAEEDPFAEARKKYDGVAMSQDPAVLSFIKEITSKHKIDAAPIRAAFDNETFNFRIIDLMTRPAEQKAAGVYIPQLLSQERIDGGKAYLKEHSEALAKAEEKYGVPAEVITAIIGVESSYGKAKFRYTAIQGLGTIAFHYPRRAEYFKGELESLILLAAKEGISPLSFRSSYAGAVGIPQFMPSNITAYGVDGDGDGIIDLNNSHVDVIFSVANFLVKHGWATGRPIATLVDVAKPLDDSSYTYRACNKENFTTVAKLQTMSVVIPEPYSATGAEKAILSRMDNDPEQGESGVPLVFFENACAVAKYNSSVKYLLAVSTLADAIK